MAAEHPEFLVVGHLNKAHGTKGEVFAWPLTDHPERTYAPGVRLHLGDEEGRPVRVAARLLEVETVRPYRRGFLVKFVGVDDRNGAEVLRGHYVLRPFEEAETPPDDEFFYHELLGCRVVARDGREVGRVREVYELQPSHMLEVVSDEGSALVPFSPTVVHRVDRENGIIEIDPPDGLLDL